jgi:hypothetical protein
MRKLKSADQGKPLLEGCFTDPDADQDLVLSDRRFGKEVTVLPTIEDP